jgi:hypothetical protein
MVSNVLPSVPPFENEASYSAVTQGRQREVEGEEGLEETVAGHRGALAEGGEDRNWVMVGNAHSSGSGTATERPVLHANRRSGNTRCLAT